MKILRSLALILCVVFLVSGCGIIKKSKPYQMSVALLNTSPEAMEALGGIEKLGWFPMGNVSLKDGEGKAELRIKVIGARQNGLLKTKLTREDQVWKFEKAYLKLEDGTMFNLLHQPSESDRDVYIEPDE